MDKTTKKEELKNFQGFVENYVHPYYGNAKLNKEYNKLYEGLITSYTQDSVKSFLDKKFKNDIYLQKVSASHFLIKVFLENFDSDKYRNFKTSLIKVDSTYGWIVSNCTLVINDKVIENKNIEKLEKDLLKNNLNVIDGKFLILQMEIKHSVELSDNELPKVLFHLSPTKYKDKILKRGIIPKSSNNKFDYPDRIYFFDNVEDLPEILTRIKKYNNEENWTVYL